MSKILITGSNGFVGCSLLNHLLDLNYGEVRASTRRPDAAFREDAKIYLVGDIGSQASWKDAVSGVECLVHTAALAHITNSKAIKPLAEFRRVNVDGALNLAHQAADAGVKRFIFISSIGVNGAETFSNPFSELSFPQPHADYALSKLEAEEGLKSICAKTGMELVVIRPPLIYDSNAPGNFGRLLNLIFEGRLFPFGSVINQRSMLALDNLLDFITICIEHPNAANQTFLIADEECVSTPQLIRLLSEGMGKPARLFPVPPKILEFGASLLGKKSMYQQLCGSLEIDITKAKNILGWSPSINVSDGLRLAGKRYLSEKII
ncbi:NAD-dependent epimerase/dehydratase family protein [Glaciimonas sp. GG7]